MRQVTPELIVETGIKGAERRQRLADPGQHFEIAETLVDTGFDSPLQRAQ